MTGDPPRPRRPGEINPESASVRSPPPHGPGQAHTGHKNDEPFEVVVRFEPFGPTLNLRVTAGTAIRELKEEAMRRFGRDAGTAHDFVLAKSGWKLDESKTVGEVGLKDLDFVAFGRPGDLEIQER